MPPARVSATQFAVAGLLANFGPMCDSQLIEAYHGIEGLPAQTTSGIRTRRRELVDLGVVKDSGCRLVLDTGRESIIWSLVPDRELQVPGRKLAAA